MQNFYSIAKLNTISEVKLSEASKAHSYFIISVFFRNTMNKPQPSYSGHKSEYSWNTTNYGSTYSPAKATAAGGNARQPTVSERASFGGTMNVKKENPTTKVTISQRSEESFGGPLGILVPPPPTGNVDRVDWD